MDPTAAPTYAQLRVALEKIAPLVHRTPVLTCRTLDDLSGAKLFFKAENFQKAGAFKYRGATFAVQTLAPEEAARGVATHSSGNHAQALALAARTRGVAAHIVMPSDSAAVKRAAVEGYGGRITSCGRTLEAREDKLRALLAETGAVAIPPYDDARIICGQGTAALELLDDIPDLDVLVTPVGGGGLLAGTAIAAHGLQPGLRVLGAEPELADDAYRSLRQGTRLPPLPPRTIADGLRTGLGKLNYDILRQHVEEILRVSEAQILDSMRLLWQRAKVVVEPSAAVALGAILANGAALAGKRVGVILSGGNVDLCRNELCNFWR